MFNNPDHGNTSHGIQIIVPPALFKYKAPLEVFQSCFRCYLSIMLWRVPTRLARWCTRPCQNWQIYQNSRLSADLPGCNKTHQSGMSPKDSCFLLAPSRWLGYVMMVHWQYGFFFSSPKIFQTPKFSACGGQIRENSYASSSREFPDWPQNFPRSREKKHNWKKMLPRKYIL